LLFELVQYLISLNRLIDLAEVGLEHRSTVKWHKQLPLLKLNKPSVLIDNGVLSKQEKAVREFELRQQGKSDLEFRDHRELPKPIEGRLFHLYLLDELRGDTDPHITIIADAFISLVETDNLTGRVGCKDL